jgi:hypothetical protein
MIQKPQKKSSSKVQKIAIVVVALVVLAGAGIAVRHFTTNSVKTTPSGVKLTPPTVAEKASGDTTKDQIVAEKNATPTPTQASGNGKKQVTPVISYAGADRLNAYVSGVLEDSGTCTATFTQGTSVITRTSSGFSNVSYTQCAPITPNLPAGSWSVIVTYSSANAQGTSQAQTF